MSLVDATFNFLWTIILTDIFVCKNSLKKVGTVLEKCVSKLLELWLKTDVMQSQYFTFSFEIRSGCVYRIVKTFGRKRRTKKTCSYDLNFSVTPIVFDNRLAVIRSILNVSSLMKIIAHGFFSSLGVVLILAMVKDKVPTHFVILVSTVDS